MWLFLFALVFAETPASVDPDYQAGVQALRNRDSASAITHFQSCIDKNSEASACHWEMGWAHYLQSNWKEVVSSWERVLELTPDRADVEEHLATARAQQALLDQVRSTREQAPTTLRPPPPPGASVRLRAVGDVMLGTDYPSGYLPPQGGAEMLEGVMDWLQDADLTFINLEGPLCDRGQSAKCSPNATNCYAFRTPTSYGDYLVEAGIDLVSTANNHAADFGAVCRADTHSLLDSYGIAWSGPPGSTASVEKNGLKVGLIAFHSSPSSNHLNNPETSKALIEATALQNDIVVVSFHGGAEGNKALHVPDEREFYYGEDRGHLRQFAREAIDAGADLILGHGPHVPRGIEIYKDRLIAYSLGNFATYGRFNLSGNLSVGLVLEAELDGEGRFVRGAILPTRQHGRGIPAKDEEQQAVDLIRSLSMEDFPSTAPQIAQDGSIAPRSPE